MKYLINLAGMSKIVTFSLYFAQQKKKIKITKEDVIYLEFLWLL